MCTCKYCGKEFPHPHGSRGKFCSRECYYAYIRTKPAEYRQIELVTLVCGHCGKEFQRRRHEVRTSISYCSRQCSGFAPGSKKPQIVSNKRTPRVEKACEICGKVFKVKAGRADRRRFCSRDCHNTYKTVHMSGPNNPNHKHGQNQRSARNIALIYFPPVCIICGWDISVDIHHILPKSEGGINTPANLAVLCPNHHRMAKMGLVTPEELTAKVQALIEANPRRLPLSMRGSG